MINLKCKRCGVKSTMDEWNKSTMEENGEGCVVELFDDQWKDCYYLCPKCGCETCGDEFLEDDDND